MSKTIWQRWVALVERIESKLTNAPLIIGVLCGLFNFIPLLDIPKLNPKYGKYIPLGEFPYPTSNATTVDDYVYGSYLMENWFWPMPVNAQLYYGAVFLTIPTAVDTLIEVSKIVIEAWRHRDISLLRKIHVSETDHIVRMTHLERLVFIFGVICLSFFGFSGVEHFRYAEIVCLSMWNLSGILTIAPIMNFLQVVDEQLGGSLLGWQS